LHAAASVSFHVAAYEESPIERIAIINYRHGRYLPVDDEDSLPARTRATRRSGLSCLDPAGQGVGEGERG
jgi:hypothetical protein